MSGVCRHALYVSHEASGGFSFLSMVVHNSTHAAAIVGTGCIHVCRGKWKHGRESEAPCIEMSTSYSFMIMIKIVIHFDHVGFYQHATKLICVGWPAYRLLGQQICDHNLILETRAAYRFNSHVLVNHVKNIHELS